MLNPTGIGLIFVAVTVSMIATPAGWFAHDIIAVPGIVREERVKCQAEVESAAAMATRDEQLRQFRIGETATDEFIRQSQAAADDRQAERDVFELEIERYAQRLGQTRAACSLTDDDLDLLGVHPLSPQPSGR